MGDDGPAPREGHAGIDRLQIQVLRLVQQLRQHRLFGQTVHAAEIIDAADALAVNPLALMQVGPFHDLSPVTGRGMRYVQAVPTRAAARVDAVHACRYGAGGDPETGAAQISRAPVAAEAGAVRRMGWTQRSPSFACRSRKTGCLRASAYCKGLPRRLG